MKKILLVPIIALSLMTGCDANQPKAITLDRWLESAEDENSCQGTYRLYDKDWNQLKITIDSNDYENYVLKAVKEGANKATRKNKAIKETGDIFFVYLLELDNPIEYGAQGCLIYVYENHIMTFSDFHYNNKYVSQRCYYEYDTEVGKKVIDTTLARAYEIRDTTQAEEQLAKQEATIQNFLAKAEETTTFSITYNDKSIEDENRSFLNALKDKEYALLSADTSTLGDNEVLATYQVNEHLLLKLGVESRETNFYGGKGNMVEVCYNYKPKFIPHVWYEEGKYGPRQRYAISQETHGELKQVLDSLVTE